MSFFRKTVSIIIAVMVVLSAASFICLADGSSSISCNTKATVGQTQSITLSISPSSDDAEIWGVEGVFSYDPNMLSYIDTTGAVANNSGGSIKFTITGTGSGKASATFNFNVISAGKCVVSANSIKYSGGADNSSYNVSGSSVSINITDASAPEQTKTPAALTTLKISNATLTPAFSPSVTSYTATVKNPIDSVNITATAAGGGSVTGTGKFSLDVGDNKRSVTAVGTDGSKKIYNITIKRLTEEETAQLEEEELKNDPLFVEIDEVSYKVVKEIGELPIPEGYTQGTTEYNGQTVLCLNDDNSKYNLYYLNNESTGEATFFTYDEENIAFKPLTYLLLNNKLYISESEPEGAIAPVGFFDDVYNLTAGTADVYRSEDSGMADFCWLYIYFDGDEGYYRYDTDQKTIQRAPDFKVGSAADSVVNDDGFSFADISTQGKIILILLGLATIFIIVIIILLIIKFTRRENEIIGGFDTDAEIPDFSAVFDTPEEIDINMMSDNNNTQE